MIEAHLFFGVPVVAGFERFLDAVVTPRFPDGLTVLDGAGRWRAPDGRMTQERSKLVVVVAAPGVDTAARLDDVRRAYQVQFKQVSVGLATLAVCADFGPVQAGRKSGTER